jgi:hypothetical protein
VHLKIVFFSLRIFSMGAIGGMLGLSGGAAGTGFATPGSAPIQTPTTTGQANTAYQGNQNALQQQQSLLSALQGQNGLGNQSSVYGQLQGVANGTGPNPAQAMLNQSTGQNVANQAALMAGQRGAGSNVGLMARQAAMQGSNAQQQAAGQGATMQANQSLNALNSMGNIANTQAGQQIGQTNANTSAQQAEQANLLNSIAGVNNANVGMQSNINSNNTSLANTMMGQQGQMIGGLMSSAGQGASMMGGSGGGGGGMSSMMEAEGGQIQSFDDGGGVQVPTIQTTAAPNPVAPAPSSSGSSGGSGGGMSSMLPILAMLAADGLDTAIPESNPTDAVQPTTTSQGPQSMFGKFVTGMGKNTNSPNTSNAPGASGQGGLYQGSKDLGTGLMSLASSPQGLPTGPATGAAVGNDAGQGYARGGMVNALVSPGEKWLSPSAVAKVKKGADPMKVGETIPGKPKVSGDKNSYANDTVARKLEVGGIVVPRSETKSANPSRKSRDFISKTLAKRPK